MRASLFPTVDSAPFLSQVLTITVCSGWPHKCGHKGGIWDELINIVSLLKRVLGYSCISNLITDNMKQSHLYLQPRTPKSHPIAQSAKWQGNTFAPSDLYQKLLAGRMRNPTKQKKKVSRISRNITEDTYVNMSTIEYGMRWKYCLKSSSSSDLNTYLFFARISPYTPSSLNEANGSFAKIQVLFQTNHWPDGSQNFTTFIVRCIQPWLFRAMHGKRNCKLQSIGHRCVIHTQLL